MRVIVLGLGYIGLPTASLLATKGMDVLGIDVRKDIVDTINAGEIHITEPDLDILVKVLNKTHGVFQRNVFQILSNCCRTAA